ncbi:MAG: TonB-dependent receptor [Campylobacterales bacterium]|nr:TonB-dependent receptor [Campylobacterales bacterium]
MFKPTRSLVAAATLVASLGANTLSLEPVTVTASAHGGNELQAPYAVEIYTQRDIEKTHAQTLYEFLNHATSVVTTPAYGNPFAQKIDMHGYGQENGYQNIVILLNGRRLNNVDMTSQLLSSIPLNAITKIEISKGSGIVTAGDGANAGVINIITDTVNTNSLTLYGGTYRTHDAALNLSHATDKVQFNLAGETYRNGGTRRIDSDGSKDEKSLTTGTFNLTYAPLSSLEIRLGGDFSNMDTIYGGSMTLDEYNADPTQEGSVDYGWGPSPSGSTHQKLTTRALTAGAGIDLSERLTLNADLYHETKTSEYVTYNSSADYTYDSAKAYLDYSDEKFSFRIGADGFKGERVGKTILDKESAAAYATGSYTYGNETVQLGYRFEKVRYDNQQNFNRDEKLHGIDAGLNHRLNTEQSFFASYSRSYQSADIDRLFSYWTGAFKGYVDPMEANTYTLGYNWIQPHNKLKISLFYADLNNEIYYYADPTYVASKNTNIDKSHKYGLDLYNQWVISPEWNALVNYNYVRATIDEETQNGENYAGKALPGVSNHNLKVAVTYMPNPATALTLTQLYRSKAYALNDFSNDFSQRQEAYKSTNISLTYTQKEYELFAKINNLFNESNGIWIRDDAIYPVDFTTTAIAGVKFIF